MADADLLRQSVDYYQECFRRHGACAKGVDWRDEESQQLRFRQLLRVAEGAGRYSITDYGCGYGALFDFLAARGDDVRYVGYDPAEEILGKAVELHGGDGRTAFTSSRAELRPTDFAVSSGVWNVKGDAAASDWLGYVLSGLECLDAIAEKGFAFNILTAYVDEDKKRSDLFYADPLFLFDHCKKRFSRHVALLHDYPLYEFTIMVRK